MFHHNQPIARDLVQMRPRLPPELNEKIFRAMRASELDAALAAKLCAPVEHVALDVLQRRVRRATRFLNPARQLAHKLDSLRPADSQAGWDAIERRNGFLWTPSRARRQSAKDDVMMGLFAFLQVLHSGWLESTSARQSPPTGQFGLNKIIFVSRLGVCFAVALLMARTRNATAPTFAQRRHWAGDAKIVSTITVGASFSYAAILIFFSVNPPKMTDMDAALHISACCLTAAVYVVAIRALSSAFPLRLDGALWQAREFFPGTKVDLHQFARLNEALQPWAIVGIEARGIGARFRSRPSVLPLAVLEEYAELGRQWRNDLDLHDARARKPLAEIFL